MKTAMTFSLFLVLGASIIAVSMPAADDTCGTNCPDRPTIALLKERCTVCHNTDRIYNAKKDEAGWTTTVVTMIGKGAKLNSDERIAVIGLLTRGICDSCKKQ